MACSRHGRLLGLRCCNCLFAFHFFPSITICCHFCRCFSFQFLSSFQFPQVWEFVNFIFPSLFRSSHWSVCLVLGTETWVPFCRFLCPSLVWKRCIARRHFILLCVSIQHGIVAAFILSIAIAVLLFMYSIHSSSSIFAVSISSSVSFLKETSLSWSHSVFELQPSTVSSSELP